MNKYFLLFISTSSILLFASCSNTNNIESNQDSTLQVEDIINAENVTQHDSVTHQSDSLTSN